MHVTIISNTNMYVTINNKNSVITSLVNGVFSEEQIFY